MERFLATEGSHFQAIRPRMLAVGRCIGTAFALATIGFSILWTIYAMRLYREYDEGRFSRPMEVNVDLTQPGEISVPYSATCSTAHGELLNLRLSPPPTSQAEAREWLAGLELALVIRDQNGEVKGDLSVNGTSVREPSSDGTITLAYSPPFGIGDYKASIRVISPATELSPSTSTIFAQYEICGLEKLAADFTAGIALCAGAVGVIVAACVGPGLLRHGIWRRIEQS